MPQIAAGCGVPPLGKDGPPSAGGPPGSPLSSADECNASSRLALPASTSYCNQNNSPQGIGTNLSEPAASTIRGDFVGRCRRWCRICRHHGSRQKKKVEKPRLALQSRDVGSQSGSDVLPSQVATPSESRQYKTAPRKKPIRMRPLHTPLARQPEASAHPREPLQLEGIEPSPPQGVPPCPE